MTAAFTAIAEMMIGETLYVSPAIPFGPAGVSLLAQVVTDAASGALAFQVLAGPAREPGVARLEKTCNEPVTFKVFRDGEPFEMTVVANTFHVTTMSLAD